MEDEVVHKLDDNIRHGVLYSTREALHDPYHPIVDSEQSTPCYIPVKL